MTRKLQHGGQLAESHTARLIRMDLDSVLSSLWQSGHIGVGELWTYYARYPYLRRLRDREMLSAAVRSSAEQLHWQREGFALAESYDADSDRYSGLVLPNDRITVTAVHDGLLIVSPARAEAQRERDSEERRPDRPPGGGGGTVVDPVPDRTTDPGPPPGKRRFFGARTLSPERYAGDFKKVTDEVLAHLAAVPGVRLTVSIEIEAEAPDGFDDDKIRTVSENATVLKFNQHGFEEE